MASRQSGILRDVAASALEPKLGPSEGRETGQRTFRTPLLRIASAAAACAILVGVLAAFVDRPIATWVHEHIGEAQFGLLTATYDGQPRKLGPFSLMASPSEALGLLAVLGFAALALAAFTGWRPMATGRVVLALCLSVFAATQVNSVLKQAFGRTWPESWLGDNPSWIRDGIFGFFPFHGGPGWCSFPSGHTAVITTTATVLWLVWPKMRIVWAALVAVVAAGLIGANTHFVSDIVGGLFLGVAVGLGSAGLLLPPNDPIRRN